MTPVINIDNSRFPKNLTFDDIFQVFEEFIHEENLNLLEVIASLMFRQAFMLDHKKKDGVWRLKIPDATANYLKSNRPHINDLPILAFFYFLKVLALNESVKYFSIGHSIKGGVGRQNNLLTYCNLIAVFWEKCVYQNLLVNFPVRRLAFLQYLKKRQESFSRHCILKFN